VNTDELKSITETGGHRAKRINPIVIGCRLLGALALIAITLFCVFGFKASFEPPNWVPYQAGYGTFGCGCLIGAMVLLHRTSARTLGALALVAIAIFSVLGFVESSLASRLAWQVVYGTFTCGGLIGATALLPKKCSCKACDTDTLR
jgi:peptidoglycan/LPS O-acetylase OafA/YrhL